MQKELVKKIMNGEELMFHIFFALLGDYFIILFLKLQLLLISNVYTNNLLANWCLPE